VGPVGSDPLIPSLRRAVVSVVAFMMLVPWVWRRVWTATAVLDWDQAELDSDVVPEDVWEAIVEVIQGEDTAWIEPDDDD